MPAFLALCLPAAAWAAPLRAAPGERLIGYGDLRFGMTVAEAAAAIGEPVPAAPADDTELIETEVVAAGMPAQRRLMFADGRLVSIIFRWGPEVASQGSPAPDATARCRALFARLQGQLGGRYGTPALGPDQSAEGEPGFAGMTFWSFADGASIALVVAQSDAGDEGRGEGGTTSRPTCQATLNYKQPPTGDGD